MVDCTRLTVDLLSPYHIICFIYFISTEFVCKILLHINCVHKIIYRFISFYKKMNCIYLIALLLSILILLICFLVISVFSAFYIAVRNHLVFCIFLKHNFSFDNRKGVDLSSPLYCYLGKCTIGLWKGFFNQKSSRRKIFFYT